MAEGGINGGLTDSRLRRSVWEEIREIEACGVFGGREWEWTVIAELVCAWIAKDELVMSR